MNYIVNNMRKEITLLRRLSPLIHHAKQMERLRKEYPDYVIIPPER
jgi:hypothetical protein